MKKIYIVLTSLMLTSLLTNGQITLTSTTSAPAAGDIYYYKRLDSTATGLSYGSTGANVTWDYSGLLDTATTQYSQFATMYANSSGTPYESSFSGETLTNTDGTYYDYYSVSSTDYKFLGGKSASSHQSLSDNKTLLTFPFTYNSTFSDTYKGHTTGTGVIDTTYGTITATSDGYGTLMLPGGLTYNNVLRVKVIDSHIDETFGYQFYYSTTSYNYFVTSQHNAVFYVQYFVTYPIGFPTYGTKSKSAWMSFTPSAINDLKNNSIAFDVFPNPAKDQTRVSYTLENASDVTIGVFNSLGQQVTNSVLKGQDKGLHNENIQLSGLANGVYTVKIQADNAFVCKKLLIQ